MTVTSKRPSSQSARRVAVELFHQALDPYNVASMVPVFDVYPVVPFAVLAQSLVETVTTHGDRWLQLAFTAKRFLPADERVPRLKVFN